MLEKKESYCPKCEKERDRYRKELQKKADKGYGVVKADKYIELRKEAEKSIYLEKTLKEKYEMEMDENILSIRYHCGCSACGFTFEYKADLSVLE